MSIGNSTGGGAVTRQQQRQDQWLEGQPGSLGSVKGRPAINPRVGLLATATVGGTTTDGDYSLTFTDENTGAITTVTVTRAGGSPATDADVAAALVAAVNSTPALRNLIRAAVNGGTPEQVDLTAVHPQSEISIVSAAPAPGTLTVAVVQTPGGALVPLGRLVVFTTPGNGQSLPGVRPPTGSDQVADFAGVVLRPRGHYPNQESPLASAPDLIHPGNTLAVGFDGDIVVRNVGSTTAEPGAAVFAVVSNAGGQEPGQFRSDADGGNTTEIEGTNIAKWVDQTPPGALGRVQFRF